MFGLAKKTCKSRLVNYQWQHPYVQPHSPLVDWDTSIEVIYYYVIWTDNGSRWDASIEVIYYYIIWTDNGSRLLEAYARRQEEKYPMIKILQDCILKLSLYSVNSVLLLYRTGNMQSQYFYHLLPLPPCSHVGFNVPARWCPVISVHM